LFLVFVGGEKNFATRGVGVEHRDAKDFASERPKAEKLLDVISFGETLGFIDKLFRFAKEELLLDGIEVIQGEGSGFDVKD